MGITEALFLFLLFLLLLLLLSLSLLLLFIRYWYNNGCLFPDMGTVFVAMDKCDTDNGCLKVHISVTHI